MTRWEVKTGRSLEAHCINKRQIDGDCRMPPRVVISYTCVPTREHIQDETDLKLSFCSYYKDNTSNKNMVFEKYTKSMVSNYMEWADKKKKSIMKHTACL